MTNYERRAHREAAVIIRRRQTQRLRLFAILTGTLLTTAVITISFLT